MPHPSWAQCLQILRCWIYLQHRCGLAIIPVKSSQIARFISSSNRREKMPNCKARLGYRRHKLKNVLLLRRQSMHLSDVITPQINGTTIRNLERSVQPHCITQYYFFIPESINWLRYRCNSCCTQPTFSLIIADTKRSGLQCNFEMIFACGPNRL